MLIEQYTKLIRTISEFHVSVENFREENGKLTLWVPDGGLYFNVKKWEIERLMEQYLGREVEIFNSLKLYHELP